MDVALENASPQEGRGCRRCNARGPEDTRANLSGKRTELEGWAADPRAPAGDRCCPAGSWFSVRRCFPPEQDGSIRPRFFRAIPPCGVVFLFAAKKKKGYVRNVNGSTG